MDNHSLKAYVTRADDDHVRVKILDTSIKTALLELGFTLGTQVDEFNIPTRDNPTKAIIFIQLRALNVCFSSGREWCPAEVFLYLRDLGLLSGGFRKISWTGPDCYVLTDEK